MYALRAKTSIFSPVLAPLRTRSRDVALVSALEAPDRLAVHEQAADPMVYRAASELIRLDDEGKKTNIEAQGQVYDVLQSVEEGLKEVGASHLTTAQILDTLANYVSGLGADFARQAKAKPLYARVMVTDHEPQDIPDCKLTSVTCIDGQRVQGDDAGKMSMTLTLYGTSNAMSQGMSMNRIFESGKKKWLLVYYGTIEGSDLHKFDTVDANLATLIQAVGAGGASAMEEIRKAIQQGTLPPEVMNLIAAVADLNRAMEAAKTPGALENPAQKIAELKAIVAEMSQALPEFQSLPQALVQAVAQSIESADAAFAKPDIEAALAPMNDNDTVMEQTQSVLDQIAELLQADTLPADMQEKLTALREEIITALPEKNFAALQETMAGIRETLVDFAASDSITPQMFRTISEILPAVVVAQNQIGEVIAHLPAATPNALETLQTVAELKAMTGENMKVLLQDETIAPEIKDRLREIVKMMDAAIDTKDFSRLETIVTEMRQTVGEIAATQTLPAEVLKAAGDMLPAVAATEQKLADVMPRVDAPAAVDIAVQPADVNNAAPQPMDVAAVAENMVAPPEKAGAEKTADATGLKTEEMALAAEAGKSVVDAKVEALAPEAKAGEAAPVTAGEDTPVSTEKPVSEKPSDPVATKVDDVVVAVAADGAEIPVKSDLPVAESGAVEINPVKVGEDVAVVAGKNSDVPVLKSDDAASPAKGEATEITVKGDVPTTEAIAGEAKPVAVSINGVVSPETPVTEVPIAETSAAPKINDNVSVAEGVKAETAVKSEVATPVEMMEAGQPPASKDTPAQGALPPVADAETITTETRPAETKAGEPLPVLTREGTPPPPTGNEDLKATDVAVHATPEGAANKASGAPETRLPEGAPVGPSDKAADAAAPANPVKVESSVAEKASLGEGNQPDNRPSVPGETTPVAAIPASQGTPLPPEGQSGVDPALTTDKPSLKSTTTSPVSTEAEPVSLGGPDKPDGPLKSLNEGKPAEPVAVAADTTAIIPTIIPEGKIPANPDNGPVTVADNKPADGALQSPKSPENISVAVGADKAGLVAEVSSDNSKSADFVATGAGDNSLGGVSLNTPAGTQNGVQETGAMPDNRGTLPIVEAVRTSEVVPPRVDGNPPAVTPPSPAPRQGVSETAPSPSAYPAPQPPRMQPQPLQEPSASAGSGPVSPPVNPYEGERKFTPQPAPKNFDAIDGNKNKLGPSNPSVTAQPQPVITFAARDPVAMNAVIEQFKEKAPQLRDLDVKNIPQEKLQQAIQSLPPEDRKAFQAAINQNTIVIEAPEVPPRQEPTPAPANPVNPTQPENKRIFIQPSAPEGPKSGPCSMPCADCGACFNKAAKEQATVAAVKLGAENAGSFAIYKNQENSIIIPGSSEKPSNIIFDFKSDGKSESLFTAEKAEVVRSEKGCKTDCKSCGACFNEEAKKIATEAAKEAGTLNATKFGKYAAPQNTVN